jgi:hypothetical protein
MSKKLFGGGKKKAAATAAAPETKGGPIVGSVLAGTPLADRLTRRGRGIVGRPTLLGRTGAGTAALAQTLGGGG